MGGWRETGGHNAPQQSLLAITAKELLAGDRVVAATELALDVGVQTLQLYLDARTLGRRQN